MGTLSLLDDIVFKLVFGSKKREIELRNLINALLGLTGPDKIAELQIINPNLHKEYAREKGCIVDVKARDERGRVFNVELQVDRQADYINRSIYYVARLFGEQIEKGQGYDQICRTIGISLLDFTLFPEIKDLHSIYRFYDVVHKAQLSDIIEMHYIELPKFKKDNASKLRNRLERWLHILKFSERYQTDLEPIPESLSQDEEIAMALRTFREITASEEVHQLVEARKKAQRDEITRLNRARKEGLEQGVKKGRQEGLREAAQRMLAAGIEPEVVSQALGIPLEGLDPS